VLPLVVGWLTVWNRAATMNKGRVMTITPIIWFGLPKYRSSSEFSDDEIARTASRTRRAAAKLAKRFYGNGGFSIRRKQPRASILK